MHGDSERQGGNAALVLCNSDVAILAPARAPGVLHDEEVGAIVVDTVADSGDSVIDVGSAARLDDSARVRSESIVFSLDCNSDWSFVDGVAEFLGIVGWGLDQAVRKLVGGGGISSALLLVSFVWIF